MNHDRALSGSDRRDCCLFGRHGVVNRFGRLTALGRDEASWLGYPLVLP